MAALTAKEIAKSCGLPYSFPILYEGYTATGRIDRVTPDCYAIYSRMYSRQEGGLYHPFLRDPTTGEVKFWGYFHRGKFAAARPPAASTAKSWKVVKF